MALVFAQVRGHERDGGELWSIPHFALGAGGTAQAMALAHTVLVIEVTLQAILGVEALGLLEGARRVGSRHQELELTGAWRGEGGWVKGFGHARSSEVRLLFHTNGLQSAMRPMQRSADEKKPATSVCTTKKAVSFFFRFRASTEHLLETQQHTRTSAQWRRCAKTHALRSNTAVEGGGHGVPASSTATAADRGWATPEAPQRLAKQRKLDLVGSIRASAHASPRQEKDQYSRPASIRPARDTHASETEGGWV